MKRTTTQTPEGNHPALTLRPGTPGDAQSCGRICYEAFRAIAEHHRFPPNFSSAEHATETLGRRLAHPCFYAVVAELDATRPASLRSRDSMSGAILISGHPPDADAGPSTGSPGRGDT